MHTSSTTKLSPSFPHLTTLSSLGFSNILARMLACLNRAHVAQGDTLVEFANLGLESAYGTMKICDSKHTKSLELLEPEPPALFGSMIAGVARRAVRPRSMGI